MKHLALLAASVFCAAGALHAQTATVTPNPAPTIITTAPYTISTSGYYQLGKDLVVTATSGNIITINSSNVTLDFGGHFIGGLGSNTGTTLMGIRSFERGNLIIQNGKVVSCYQGIVLDGNNSSTSANANNVIENMLIANCFYNGIALGSPASTIIRNNVISNIGGGTNSALSEFGKAVGIVFSTGGSGNKVSDNIIDNIKGSSQDSFAIIGTGATSASGNEITGVTVTAPAVSYGISGATFAVHNKLANMQIGIAAQGGSSNTVYQDNLAINVTTPFSGGQDAGGNFPASTSVP